MVLPNVAVAANTPVVFAQTVPGLRSAKAAGGIPGMIVLQR